MTSSGRRRRPGGRPPEHPRRECRSAAQDAAWRRTLPCSASANGARPGVNPGVGRARPPSSVADIETASPQACASTAGPAQGYMPGCSVRSVSSRELSSGPPEKQVAAATSVELTPKGGGHTAPPASPSSGFAFSQRSVASRSPSIRRSWKGKDDAVRSAASIARPVAGSRLTTTIRRVAFGASSASGATRVWPVTRSMPLSSQLTSAVLTSIEPDPVV